MDFNRDFNEFENETMEVENRRFNKKIVIIAICITVACLVAFFSVLHLQRKNIISDQKLAGIQAPKNPQVNITNLITTTTTTTEATTIPDNIVRLDCSSVQNDLKIKLLNNKNGEYINGVAYSVVVTDSAKKQTTYTNKDLKGLIYVSDVKAGTYTIKLLVPEGYTASVDTATVKVKDKVEYKAIKDIKEKIDKNPNPKEDTKAPQANIPVENVLHDTVAFVPSTVVTIPAKTTYVLVDFASIKKPVLSETTTMETTVTTTNSTTSNQRLTDVSGNQMYIKSGSGYREALASDYSSATQFFRKEITPETKKYTGWQTIGNKRYYYDKNNNFVTGNQVINGAKYTFGSDGALAPGAGVLGIDVSTYQGNINWKAVKESGVQFAIIRVGYRGWGTGAVVKDAWFDNNIKGASANGIDVGLYYFSQAINATEAVEEASTCIALAKGYKIKYPIFIDTETSGGKGSGRADNLTVAQRTEVCIAFCETIKSGGYKAGVYTNKHWFETKLNTAQLNKYIIWLAQYNDKVTYKGKYDIWQYTKSGSVAGINGNVDMNLSYMYF